MLADSQSGGCHRFSSARDGRQVRRIEREPGRSGGTAALSLQFSPGSTVTVSGLNPPNALDMCFM